MQIVRITLRLKFLFLTKGPLSFRACIVLAWFIVIRWTTGKQYLKIGRLQELKSTEYCAEHIAAKTKRIIYGFSIDDAQEDEMGMDFIDFAGNFTQDIRNYTQDVVRIDLKDLPKLYQTMVVVDISTDSLLHCLQLGQDLLRPHPSHHLRHFVNGIEEVSLYLQLGVDTEERRSEDGS
jgi:hypothetical protein